MIAVDTNILIYAHREESPFYDIASRRLTELCKQSSWAVPWPCVHEFFSIVTHPTIFKLPTPMSLAIEQIEAMRRNPTLYLLSETDLHWSQLREIMRTSRIRGGPFTMRRLRRYVSNTVFASSGPRTETSRASRN